MIKKEDINNALEILKRYKAGNAAIYARVIENEEWFKLRHWEFFRNKKKNIKDPEPSSGWLMNNLMNKHADCMDNFPEAVFLPREESDKTAAEELSAIVPAIMEQNEFETTYDDNSWYKLKMGTAVYGVFWNKNKNNGLGDVEISKIDMLNIFWEPGITNIQQSRNIFTVKLVDNDQLETLYGKKLKLGDPIGVSKYLVDETIDTSEKSTVIDWYYKKLMKDGSTILHYCQFIGDKIIYSSENEDPKTPFYIHNEYPFVFDKQFPEESTCVGFGYIDLEKDSQKYIDKLQQTILKNAIYASRRRFFVSNNSNVNKEELANAENEIISVAGNVSDDKIREMTVHPLADIYVSVLNNKISELKETSGNRDWAQGSTASGVTAASAIAALQEAGSKLSRDMIKATFRAHSKIVYYVVELIRQFYDAPRRFRITNKRGEDEFVSFSNDALKPQVEVEFGIEHARLPVFDIRIKSQKSNPFSQASMNEEAKEMFARGMFNPQLADQTLVAMQMMDFEGKENVVKMISQNGLLLQKVQQMEQQMTQMAQVIYQTTGKDLSALVGATGQEASAQGRPIDQPDVEHETNSVGRAYNFAKRDRTESARAQSAAVASPR